jgi:hypothetical protein
MGERTQNQPQQIALTMDSAFTARFRFKDKDQKGNSKAPDKNLIIDFTAEDAKKAAKFLMDKATEIELGGNSTIRQYKGKNDYSEVPGFTLWGSYWSNNEGGTIAPRAD